VCSSLRPFPAFLDGFGVRGLVDYEGASAATTLENAVTLELAVGAGDRARSEAQLGGQVADGWHAATWFQPADGDHHRELSPELFEERDGCGGVEAQDHLPVATGSMVGIARVGQVDDAG